MERPGKISELEQQLKQGQISRRDFLRAAAALGLSLGVSEVLAACGGVETPAPAPETRVVDDSAIFPDQRSPANPYDDNNIFPTRASGEYIPPTSTPGPESPAAPAPTTAPPKIVSWYCAACGERFPSSDALKKHAGEAHGWRLPEVERVNEPTYSEFLVGKVERFDERDTVFSRTLWDEPYQALAAAAAAKAPQDGWGVMEGNALVAGAIYVDDTAGALHPNYYGYMGHVAGVGGLYGWDDPVGPKKYPVEDPAWMTERIKQVARFYGANLVGITETNPLWVYSHSFERSTGAHEKVVLPYQYAIVLGIEMDWSGIYNSPGYAASAATALAYSRMAEISSSLAKYIRMLGYPALPSGNDTGQSIPMAIDAGLGELGRSGLLLTPEYGSRVRICKVFTSLPLVPDKPVDFGIRRFCETCHICAQACPADAIRWEDRTTETTSISNRKGILRWPVDVARCYLFWQENGCDCANCIAACPWGMHSPRGWLET